MTTVIYVRKQFHIVASLMDTIMYMDTVLYDREQLKEQE